jgi:hypothetical protein
MKNMKGQVNYRLTKIINKLKNSMNLTRFKALIIFNTKERQIFNLGCTLTTKEIK